MFIKNKTNKIISSICLLVVVVFFVGAPFSLSGSNITIQTVSAEADFVLDAIGIDLPRKLLAETANFILSGAGSLTYLGGVMLDEATDITVISMGSTIRNVTAITTAWKVLRDIGNIVIIFSLLVIGIATILRYSSYGMKTLLVRLIVVALLINFSLFFTKAIIDGGNILSFQFYNQLQSASCSSEGIFKECISNSFADRLRITTIYDTTQGFEGGGGVITQGLTGDKIIIAGIMGTLFLVITAFVFLAAAILLLIRFVVLVILMILSPLAFAGMILPYTQKYSSMWWNTLFSQTFFAPILFLMFWVSLVVLDGIQPALGLNGSFGAAFQGGASASGVFANFAIVIGFMIASLLLAKQMGAYGSKTMVDWGSSLRKWGQGVAGRNIISRPFRMVDNALARTGLGSSAIGQSVRRGTTGLIAGAKFQSGENLSDVETANRKDLDNTVSRLADDPKKLAGFIKTTGGSNRDYIYGKLSARDRAAVEAELKNPALQDVLRSTLTPEEREKTDKSSKETQEAKENKAIRDNIKTFVDGGAVTLTNPTTGGAYTIKELMDALPDQEARKLPHEVRINSAAIKEMSSRQLHDLRTQGKLKPDEVRMIKSIIVGPTPYANQTAQWRYINQPAQAAFWI